MNQIYPKANAETDSLARREPVTVLLAYRDADHEHLGKTFWQQLARYLHWGQGVRVSEWKFEMITSPALNRLATAEARETRLILLAAEADEGLPDKVRTWLGDWAGYRAAAGFLVVLLTENLPGSAAHWPDYSGLVAQVRSTGTELVVCPIGPTVEQRGASLFAQSWRVRPTGVVPLGDVPEVASLIGAV